MQVQAKILPPFKLVLVCKLNLKENYSFLNSPLLLICKACIPCKLDWHGYAIVCAYAMRQKSFEHDGGAKVAQPHANGKSVLYTLHDLAEMFQVTIRTIYNWMDAGRFSNVKVGSKTYVTEIQLQEFLANHQVKTFKNGGFKND